MRNFNKLLLLLLNLLMIFFIFLGAPKCIKKFKFKMKFQKKLQEEFSFFKNKNEESYEGVRIHAVVLS